jgi:hypothetical protein
MIRCGSFLFFYSTVLNQNLYHLTAALYLDLFIFLEKFSEKDESEKFPSPPFFIKNEMLQCTTVSNLNVAHVK